MLAIIDGDVLAYLACKERPAPVIFMDDNGNKLDVRQLDEDGKRIPWKYTKEEDAFYLKKSWMIFKSLVSDLVDTVNAEDFVMAVKGPDNFRNEMYPMYKMNRHSNVASLNEFVPSIRQLAVMEELAVASHGREADDLLRMWAEQAKKAGRDYIICSMDKDLLCIPGKHYLLHRREFARESDRFIEMSEDASCRFFYEQLLKGDPTDNIPGIPRIGEVKAKQILSSAKTEAEFQELVIDAYIKAYGDKWADYLLSNGKMLYLQKHEQDYFNFNDWPIAKELLYA
jgi:5'-3' exonuclease